MDLHDYESHCLQIDLLLPDGRTVIMGKIGSAVGGVNKDSENENLNHLLKIEYGSIENEY